MNKLLILLASFLILGTSVKADEDRPIQPEQLPAKAQTFIKTYFPKADISIAKEESGMFDKSYDVIFSNGDKIEFDKQGAWKEVQCKFSGKVPAGIVPEQIQQHVSQKYPNVSIINIEKKKNEYEIKLANGWELSFDKKFNLIDMEH